jgi:hypothetical protein
MFRDKVSVFKQQHPRIFDSGTLLPTDTQISAANFTVRIRRSEWIFSNRIEPNLAR